MDLDELFPDRKSDPLALLGKQDLDPLSVEELEHRIEALSNEIERTRAKISAASAHRSAAEELFKR